MSENNMYKLVSSAISGLDIGEGVKIDRPDNLPYFRKYLCDIGSRTGKKFMTKVIGGKLSIMRVEYSNIHLI